MRYARREKICSLAGPCILCITATSAHAQLPLVIQDAELAATGTLVSVVDSGGNSENGFGDWVLGTKIRLLTDRGRRPATSLLWEVKIPAASNDEGVGTDETDFFAHLLL